MDKTDLQVDREANLLKSAISPKIPFNWPFSTIGMQHLRWKVICLVHIEI